MCILLVCVHQITQSSLFIAVPVPSQESEWSCVCVLGNNHFLIGRGAGIFSRYYFLMRKKAKKLFPIVWNRNTFFLILLVLYYSNSAAQYVFLAGDSINFFFQLQCKIYFFFQSARALKYLKKKNPRYPDRNQC